MAATGAAAFFLLPWRNKNQEDSPCRKIRPRSAAVLPEACRIMIRRPVKPLPTLSVLSCFPAKRKELAIFTSIKVHYRRLVVSTNLSRWQSAMDEAHFSVVRKISDFERHSKSFPHPKIFRFLSPSQPQRRNDDHGLKARPRVLPAVQDAYSQICQ